MATPFHAMHAGEEPQELYNMNKNFKILITAVVLLLTVVLIYWKNAKIAENSASVTTSSQKATAPETKLPRMLEFGSTTCVPCKMMEEVLESLRHQYSTQLQVDFIDVTKNIEAGKKYKIQLIPTQIFFNPDGKEIFRHEGFFPKKEIIAKFAELGFPLKVANSAKNGSKKQADSKKHTPGLIATLFASLTSAVTGSVIVAVFAAFTWGVLSILLSPCHLASIPLIVGFINDQHKMTTKRAFTLASLFAFGILLTIAIIGVITAATGHMLGDLGKWTNYIVSIIFIIIGLHLLGILPMPWSGPGQIKMKKKGFLAAFILGLVFGVAIGPCTFAYMAPMLAVTFKASSTNNVGYGILLLIIYGVGHCSVIVFAGTFTEWIQKYLNWNEDSKAATVLKKICAILVICGGLYLIYTT